MNTEGQFKEAVLRHIGIFNSERGRRKELAPEMVDSVPKPFHKFGRILEMGDGSAECGEEEEMIAEGIDRMAKSTIRTLLRRKPRPAQMALNVLRDWNNVFHPDKYLFRLMLPARESIKP